MAGFNLQRTGDNPNEHTISVANAYRLRQLWSSGTNQWIDPPPVLAAGVKVGDATESLVYDGSAHGTFFAFNAANGAIVWQDQLGWRHAAGPNAACRATPWGITVIDRAANRIYVVDGYDKLYALNLSTGKLLKGWPVSLSSISQYEHVWSGLTEVNGEIYVAVASDCVVGPYHGRLIEVSTRTAKVTATFYVDKPGVSTGGGVWGWGGASVDLSHQDLFIGTGNGPKANSNAGFSDSVVKLKLGSLKVLGSDNPDIPQGDNDFGSTPVLYHPPGCPAELAVENKLGVLYIYDQSNIHKPVQSLVLAVPHHFIGDAAWSYANNLLYVSVPQVPGGTTPAMVALKPVRQATGGCQLTQVWHTRLGSAPPYVDSPPTVANGVVYVGTGKAQVVYAVSAKTAGSSGITISGARSSRHRSW
jgi:outer membrane protein assembly factor BamB